MKKCSKKGFMKDGTNTGKKGSSKVTCFPCHEMEYYVGQCSFKKGKGMKQVVVGTVARVEEMTS